MKVQSFFSKHPVFTYEEFDKFLSHEGEKSDRTTESFINYHIRANNIIRIRRGLFASVKATTANILDMIDPYLIAGRLTPDVSLAYHTALEFHGKAHSIHSVFYILTNRAIRNFSHNDCEFKFVKHPKSVREKKRENYGILDMDRMGLTVRVTGYERLLVDMFDRLDLSGGWEEVWLSMESVEYFNLDTVLEYTSILGNSTTTAKVGYFLDQHKETLMVDDSVLNDLKSRRPQKPHYIIRKSTGKLVSEWNLVIPENLLALSRRGLNDIT